MNVSGRFLFRRLVYVAITLFLIATIVFLVTHILPGNAATMILGRYATEAKIAALESQLNLNAPLHVQYVDWMVGFVTGNWGESYSLNRPVADVVISRGIRSAQLAFLTLMSVTVVGIPLGVIAAVYRNSVLDLTILSGSYVGISIPEFVTGTILLVLFGGPVFSFFPTYGYEPLSAGIVTWAKHMALPVITLTILLLAHVVRLTRSEMIETLQSEYVRTARLKGLDEYKVLFKHALRNGLLPTVTILALDLGYLMGSIVVVEEVFAFPGLGRLIVGAIGARDIPLLQVSVLLVATIYAFANLAADVIYGILDPRVEY